MTMQVHVAKGTRKKKQNEQKGTRDAGGQAGLQKDRSSRGENRASGTKTNEQSGEKDDQHGKQKEGSNTGENRTSTGDEPEAVDQILLDDCDLQPGQFVAVTHHYWSNEPLIGEILEVKSEVVKIQWWSGSYSRKWTKEMISVEGCMQLNIEEITRRQIILKFTWSEGRKLPNDIKKKIQLKYTELRR